MPNIYVHTNGGNPKVWARNVNGDCIWGRLSGGRQLGHTAVAERKKESEGYAFVGAFSWEAIEAVLMGGVAKVSSSAVWAESAELVSKLKHMYRASEIRIYDPPGSSPLPATTKPAERAATVPKNEPLKSASQRKTVGDAIAEWAKAKAPGENPEAAAWSW